MADRAISIDTAEAAGSQFPTVVAAEVQQVAWEGDKPAVIGAGADDTAARAAINAASTDEVTTAIEDADIPGQVADAVAADGTVAAAAAAAVTADIAGRDLVEGDDHRLPQIIDPYGSYALIESDEAGYVSRYVDSSGQTWVKLHPDVKVHSSNISDDVPIPLTVPTDGAIVYGITDQNGNAAVAVHADGSVTIGKPSTATVAALGGALARVTPEPSWSTKKAFWNPEKALYNYHPTKLQHWFAALANATEGLASAHITTFIDSETYGAAATGVSQPKWLNSWPGRLRRQLDVFTTYPSGTGIVPALNILQETPADDPRWVFGSAATQLVSTGQNGTPNYGVQGRGAVQLTNSGGNGWFTFTPVGNVDRFTIYALADSGATGTATVKVDGTTIGTFDVSAAGGGGTLARQSGLPTNVIAVDVPLAAIVAAIPAFVAGTHTLRVEGPSGSSTTTIWGVEGGTGKGVRISNMARSGLAVQHMVLDDTVAHTFGMPLHFDTPKADLAILMLGLNDRANTSGTFKAAVTTAISRIQAAGGDVLLVCPGQPDYATLPGDLAPRLNDMYSLADTYDLPLLDLAWMGTDYATASALGLKTDGIHSRNKGAGFNARPIFNVVTGG